MVSYRSTLFGAALLAGTMLLTGCAGTPSQSHRYTLPDDTRTVASITAAPASGAPAHSLVLRSVRLANYLDGDGIVLQLDDITLNQARDHLWAEDLGRQLERGMRTRLANRLPDTRVLGDGRPTGALELRIDVEHFQGHYDGLAIVRGEWQLRDARGDVIELAPFSVATTLDADGYPALVRALGRTWDQVADELASRIVELR